MEGVTSNAPADAASEVVTPAETIVNIQVHLIGNRLGVKVSDVTNAPWDETNPAHVLAWYIHSHASDTVGLAISAWRVERERLAAFLANGGTVEGLKAQIDGDAADDSEGGTPA